MATATASSARFSLDGDSLLATMRGEITDADGWLYHGVVRWTELNAWSTTSYHVSQSTENLWTLELGADIPIPMASCISKYEDRLTRQHAGRRRRGANRSWILAAPVSRALGTGPRSG